MDRDLLDGCPQGKQENLKPLVRDTISGSRAKAVRLKCIECCGWDRAEARRCQITSCALWGFGGQQEPVPYLGR